MISISCGELSVGDQVFDSHGNVCNVLFVTEVQHNRECFDVVFSDGSVVVADADHRWLTRSYLERRSLDRGTKGQHEPQVRTTTEIRDSLRHRHNRNHSVDVTGNLECPARALPLDPYLLGVWLGDGSGRDGEITSADPEILAAFDNAFKRGHSSMSGAAVSQYFKGLRVRLRDMGVLENKHVPAAYLRASAEQRLALLQGLMDTDGHAARDNTVEFCNTEKRLADAVFELAASLGQQPKLYQGRATLYGKDCGPKFRVCWQPTTNVFRLARKSERLRLGRYKQSQIKARRYIEDVRPRASVPVKCITVDSPDHSYLCGKAMIPTHNTLLDLLMSMVVGAKRAVLLVPPQLKAQLLEVDWKFYGQHWKLPNLAGAGIAEYHPGRPMLYVVAFSELSGAAHSDLLHQLKPDCLIIDEAHSVRNRTAARTKRLLRFLKDFKDTRVFAWSGTLTSKSLKDYAHLAEHALREGSPVPLHWPTVEEWASHLDPVKIRSPIGALRKLTRDGKGTDAREGFKDRLNATLGVVSSGDTASSQASLTISERVIKTIPFKVKEALERFESTAKVGAWQRPDGEELVDALSAARCARELSCGFFYRWRWPRGEKVEVIESWLEARKEWHKELREKLKLGRSQMDSPLLCTKAAIRWEKGYVHIERDEQGRELKRVEVAPHSKNGPLPVWESDCWPRWERERDNAKPETEAVWLDDYLVDDAIDWLQEAPGLLWYDFNAYADRIVKRAKARDIKNFTLVGPGTEANKYLARDDLSGAERLVISIRAHGTGKNLQMFSRNLVANPPSDGATWEQLLGRTHRAGQVADEVTFDVYRHTESFVNAVDRARDLSQYIEGTFGVTQRLASVASWGF